MHNKPFKHELLSWEQNSDSNTNVIDYLRDTQSKLGYLRAESDIFSWQLRVINLAITLKKMTYNDL